VPHHLIFLISIRKKSWIRIRIRIEVDSKIRTQIRIKFNNSGAVEAENGALEGL
jgi:hypothetical protein